MKLGVIGCGFRALAIIKAFYQREAVFDSILVFDKNAEKSAQGLYEIGYDKATVVICNNFEDLISRKPDGIFIATNCDTHTDFALKVMKHNIPMLLEKPVCTTYRQLERLTKGAENYKNQAVVSFPLRGAPLCSKAKQLISGGILGEIHHVQAVNNVPYGSVYYHDWYRDEKITGGLFLQKATHDIDYILYLLEKMPVQIAAMESKTYFKGDNPPKTKCAGCLQYTTCKESPYVIKNLDHMPAAKGEYCCFAKDTGNHDSASVLMRLENGVHVAYSQNFYSKRDAAKRGARFIGSEGTLEMDFPSQSIIVYGHRLAEKQTYNYNQPNLKHFGGDDFLIDSFLEILSNKAAVSKAPLIAGLSSAAICLAAEKSAKENKFIDIDLKHINPYKL